MIENFVSLLLFTYISQAAIGIILVREILIITTIINREDILSKHSQYLITLLLLISMGIAFMHLHNPLRAVYALSNLAKSPLSMEIGSLSLLLGCSIILSYITFKGILRRYRYFLSILSALFAVVLLATMVLVYYLPSVPAWSRPSTPIAFVFTVVSAGSALAACILARENIVSSIRLTGIAVVATLALLVVSTLSSNLLIRPLATIFFLQSIATILSVTLYILSIMGKGMNKMYQMTVIMCMLIILSGILARLQFFLSFDHNIL